MRVLIDTREKAPWHFNHPDVTHVESHKLDTGDYSLEGFKDLLCIERKRGGAEFAGNTSSARFRRELDRMQDYKYRYIIFECSEMDIVDYPRNSGIPKKKWKYLRVKGKFMMAFIQEIRNDYDIEVIFAGSITNGELVAIDIMKEVYANERRLHPDS